MTYYKPIPQETVSKFYEFKGVTNVVNALTNKGYSITPDIETNIFHYLANHPLTDDFEDYLQELINELKLK